MVKNIVIKNVLVEWPTKIQIPCPSFGIRMYVNTGIW